MPLIQWDDSMSVGVDELDSQHKTLINLINEAYEAIQRHDEHMMTSLITKMRDYANHHFTTEEGYLKKHAYPHFEEHKVQHVKFNHTVNEFQKKLFEKTNLSQIFVYLSRWLTTHIMDEDKKYSAYMPHENGTTNQGSSS